MLQLLSACEMSPNLLRVSRGEKLQALITLNVQTDFFLASVALCGETPCSSVPLQDKD